jgi:hypothetical protein
MHLFRFILDIYIIAGIYKYSVYFILNKTKIKQLT